MEISQYQIILVDLDNSNGNETKKSLQCVVISPDEMNKYLKTVTVAPLTSDSAGCPTRVKIRYNNKILLAVLDQIATIEKQTILKVLGELSVSEIKKIKSVIKEIFID
jgi:mRNA interferase MazF